MTLRDELLSIAADVRTLPQSLGIRRVRVWLRSQSSTAVLNTGGTITTTDTEVLPRPRVALPKEQPGWPGGAIAPAYDGRAARRRFTIGPLTREHTAGGYKLTELFPVTPTARARPLIALADESDDGEIGTTAVAFRVESVRLMQFSLYLDVIEADTVT